jgi:hypothetical protein
MDTNSCASDIRLGLRQFALLGFYEAVVLFSGIGA